MKFFILIPRFGNQWKAYIPKKEVYQININAYRKIQLFGRYDKFKSAEWIPLVFSGLSAEFFLPKATDSLSIFSILKICFCKCLISNLKKIHFTFHILNSRQHSSSNYRRRWQIRLNVSTPFVRIYFLPYVYSKRNKRTRTYDVFQPNTWW